MKTFKTLVILGSFLGFISQISAANVAVIGNSKITVKEFNSKYEKVLKSSVHPPTKAAYLEDLVRLEVGLQEAKKKKIENDPVVKERYRQILYAALVEKAIGKQVEKIKINESDMKKYYRNSPELRTSHILIQLAENANKKQRAEAKTRAQKILKDVRSSKKSFAELVVLYSEDQSTKRNGGDIGWQSRLTIVPQYYNAAFKMKKGSLSKRVVETKFGYHIIKLIDSNPYKRANKRHLRQVIFDQKRGDVFNKYFRNLKKKYKISVNKKLLK